MGWDKIIPTRHSDIGVAIHHPNQSGERGGVRQGCIIIQSEQILSPGQGSPDVDGSALTRVALDDENFVFQKILVADLVKQSRQATIPIPVPGRNNDR
jgi:hypothetical protein